MYIALFCLYWAQFQYSILENTELLSSKYNSQVMIFHLTWCASNCKGTCEAARNNNKN